MNAKAREILLLAAILLAAASCASVNQPPRDAAASAGSRPDAAVTEMQRKSISGEHAPGDAAYLEYYRSTCRIDADAAPDPAALDDLWQTARTVTPEQAAYLKKYRSSCNIR